MPSGWANAQNSYMRQSLAFFLIGLLGVCGQAEARLYETYAEIEKRVGKLEIIESDVCGGERMFRGVIQAKVSGKEGSDVIVYYFLESKPRPEMKCERVKYIRKYQSYNDIKMTPDDAQKILKQICPVAETKMKIEESEGVDGSKALEKWWKIVWRGPNGEEARAEPYLTPMPGMSWQFIVSFSSEKWIKLAKARENLSS